MDKYEVMLYPKAFRDIDDIYAYIALDKLSPENARGQTDRIWTALKKLEADKLVNRKLYPEIPPKVEYSLTSLGKSLMSPLDGIIQWALEHSDEILEHRQKTEKQKKV